MTTVGLLRLSNAKRVSARKARRGHVSAGCRRGESEVLTGQHILLNLNRDLADVRGKSHKSPERSSGHSKQLSDSRQTHAGQRSFPSRFRPVAYRRRVLQTVRVTRKGVGDLDPRQFFGSVAMISRGHLCGVVEGADPKSELSAALKRDW
jgi:hypothetical protein